MPFSPLALSWSGRSELKSLVRAEWQGGLAPLRGDGLLAAFLSERVDGAPAAARRCPSAACSGPTCSHWPRWPASTAITIRVLGSFELDLLRDLGVVPSFQICGDGEPIDPDHWYCVDLQRGLQRSLDSNDPERLPGLTVLALARRDLSDPSTLAAARPVLRRLIGYHLEGKPLNARRVLMDLRAL